MSNRGFSDLLSSASSLLNSKQEGNGSSSHAHAHAHAHKPSKGEIYASAQVVMNAAKTKLQKHDSSAEGVDYGKLAGAAGTLIGAASHYGKIEKTAFGKYAQKAQKHLHSYEIKHGKPGTTVPAPQSSASPGYGQDYPPSLHTPSEVNLSQPSAPPQGYPTAYPPQGNPAGQGHPHSSHTPSEVNLSRPSAPPQSYATAYPPQGYPASPGYGQGHAPSWHTPSEVNLSQPSTPPQGYPTAYPRQDYPDAQQGYGRVPQGHSKPAGSHANVDNYPPVGYPPAGYPTSAGNYNRPSKYS